MIFSCNLFEVGGFPKIFYKSSIRLLAHADDKSRIKRADIKLIYTCVRAIAFGIATTKIIDVQRVRSIIFVVFVKNDEDWINLISKVMIMNDITINLRISLVG
jgi:hypothetical protein